MIRVGTTLARWELRYRLTDPEMAAAIATGATRNAMRLNAGVNGRDTRRIPQAIKIAVWNRDGGLCVECGSNQYLEFDHAIPWSKGGATSETNLRLLCRGCNARKSDNL